MKFLLLFIIILSTNIFASSIEKLAKELKLYAGTKASIQWERVFSSTRHLKKYKLDTLDVETKIRLKKYLILHSADSDQPIVPGL